VRSHLYAAYDVGYLDEDALETLKTQAEEVARLISSLRGAVERRQRASKG
jgi:hypothetical protein